MNRNFSLALGCMVTALALAGCLSKVDRNASIAPQQELTSDHPVWLNSLAPAPSVAGAESIIYRPRFRLNLLNATGTPVQVAALKGHEQPRVLEASAGTRVFADDGSEVFRRPVANDASAVEPLTLAPGASAEFERVARAEFVLPGPGVYWVVDEVGLERAGSGTLHAVTNLVPLVVTRAGEPPPKVPEHGRLSDAELTDRLAGSWEATEPDGNGEKVALEITYDRDGTVRGWFWNHEHSPDGTPLDVKVTVSAHWKIHDGRTAVDDCVTDPAGRLPSHYRSVEILWLRPKGLLMRSLEDGTLVYRRRKQ